MTNANPFKKGDRVRQHSGKLFGGHAVGVPTYAVVTIDKVRGAICWIEETGTWIDHSYLELAPAEADGSPAVNAIERIVQLEEQVASLQALTVALTEQLASEAKHKTRVSEFGLGLLARNRFYVEELRKLVGDSHKLFFMRLTTAERQAYIDWAQRDLDQRGREAFAIYPEEDSDGND